MRKIFALICTFTTSLLLVACAANPPAAQNSLVADNRLDNGFGLWPQVSGRLGSYDAQTNQDLSDMAASGVTMLVGGRPNESNRVSNGISYIDHYPWSLIVQYGCADFFTHRSTSCEISEAMSTKILSLWKSHLASQIGNRNVIAYWFLDDYPGGDISSVLQQMHGMLERSNTDANSIFPRPAICGFGGSMASIKQASITRTDPILSYYRKALTNFRRSYCDMVALYPYAVNSSGRPNDPSQFDWSMTYLLPAMLNELQVVGWDRASEPLIGFSQSFGWMTYVAPTKSDITAQMMGYCKAGAVAIIAYSWNDGFQAGNPDVPMEEPVNSPEMRAALVEGMKRCRSYWQPSVPTSVRHVDPQQLL